LRSNEEVQTRPSTTRTAEPSSGWDATLNP